MKPDRGWSSAATALALAVGVAVARPGAASTRASEAPTWTEAGWVMWNDPVCGVFFLDGVLKDAPSKSTNGVAHAAEPRPAQILSSLTWEPIDDRPTPDRVVILIHGLDEVGGIWDDLAPALQSSGYSVARFEYPNDDPIGESASMLAGHLRQLRRSGTSHVDLVCHSMGGLVARDCLTRLGLYGGSGRGHQDLPDIDRVITLGTPNQGSAWVKYRGVMEWRERVMRAIETENWRALDPADPHERRGGAAMDLTPGSEFLKGLNARTLPKDVAITVIAAQITDGERTGWSELAKNPRLAGAIGEERLSSWVARGESWMSDLGDGVVPLDSTPLDGVDDYVVVRANHRSMVRRMGALDGMVRMVEGSDEDGPPPALPVVLQRLGQRAQGPASQEQRGKPGEQRAPIQ